MSERVAEITNCYMEGTHCIVHVLDERGEEHTISIHPGDFIDPMAALCELLCKKFSEAK